MPMNCAPVMIRKTNKVIYRHRFLLFLVSLNHIYKFQPFFLKKNCLKPLNMTKKSTVNFLPFLKILIV